MTEPSSDELRFDVITLVEGRLVHLFKDLPLTLAEILSGLERDEFDGAIMHRGWAGVSPSWHGFKPMAIVPHGELLKKEQFAYIMELE